MKRIKSFIGIGVIALTFALLLSLYTEVKGQQIPITRRTTIPQDFNAGRTYGDSLWIAFGNDADYWMRYNNTYNSMMKGKLDNGVWHEYMWSAFSPEQSVTYDEDFVAFDSTAYNGYADGGKLATSVDIAWAVTQDISGGAIRIMIDSSSADTSLFNYQVNGESFLSGTSNDMWVEYDFRLHDSTLVSCILGATNLDSDSLRNARADSGDFASGIYFKKATGTNLWKFITQSTTATNAVTVFDSNGDSTAVTIARTQMQLGFKVIAGTAYPYVNGYRNSGVTTGVPTDYLTLSTELGASTNQIADTLTLYGVKGTFEK